MTVKLPLVILIALLSAVLGGAVSYVIIPNTNAARPEAQDNARSFFDGKGELPTTGGQKMAPRF